MWPRTALHAGCTRPHLTAVMQCGLSALVAIILLILQGGEIEGAVPIDNPAAADSLKLLLVELDALFLRKGEKLLGRRALLRLLDQLGGQVLTVSAEPADASAQVRDPSRCLIHSAPARATVLEARSFSLLGP